MWTRGTKPINFTDMYKIKGFSSKTQKEFNIKGAIAGLGLLASKIKTPKVTEVAGKVIKSVDQPAKNSIKGPGVFEIVQSNMKKGIKPNPKFSSKSLGPSKEIKKARKDGYKMRQSMTDEQFAKAAAKDAKDDRVDFGIFIEKYGRNEKNIHHLLNHYTPGWRNIK